LEKIVKKRIIVCCVSLGFLVITCLVIWGIYSYKRYMEDPTYPGTQIVGKDPDDTFSKNVVSEIDDAYLYFGKRDFAGGITDYNFYLNKCSADSNTLFLKSVNQHITDVYGKTQIVILCGSGVYRCVYSLRNYENESSYPPFSEGFYYLDFGPEWDYLSSDLYDYSSIEGIKYVEMPDLMQEKADEEGIDWYEIWPDLEEVIVYETDERGRRIE